MFQQTTNTSVTSPPDFDTDSNGTVYMHTQTVTDNYAIFDPMGIQPQIVNLQMDNQGLQDSIDKNNATISNLQGQAQTITAAIPSLADKLNAVAQPANQVAQPADPAPKI